MLRIRVGMRLVAVGLAGLSQKNEWGRVRRLKAEREIKQNERVQIEMDDSNRVHGDPRGDERGLSDEERWSAKESGKCLGALPEPARAERTIQVHVRRL